jgi:hypothetical protein
VVDRGISYRVGETCNACGRWPNLSALEPINEGARRASRFFERHSQSRFLPERLMAFDGTLRRYFLPAGTPLGRHHKDGRVIDVPAPEEEVSGPNVPKYMAPGRSEPFVHLGWPRSGFRAANRAAADVITWFLANHEHEDFASIPSGFNLYDLRPWLPKLREAYHSAAADLDRPRGARRIRSARMMTKIYGRDGAVHEMFELDAVTPTQMHPISGRASRFQASPTATSSGWKPARRISTTDRRPRDATQRQEPRRDRRCEPASRHERSDTSRARHRGAG